MAFQLGAAFKPSLLGDNKLDTAIFYAKVLARLGYRYLVLDSERAVDDLSLRDFEELVSVCKLLGFPEPVITIPVRRGDCWERLGAVVDVVSRDGFGGVCLVAGNSAYLTREEASQKPGKLLLEAAEVFRRKCRFNLLMVGTERVEKTAAKIAANHRAIPVMLMTPNIVEETRLYSHNGLRRAVYVPYYFGEELPRDVAEKVHAYVSRRVGDKNVDETWRQFVYTGPLNEFTQLLRDLSANNIDVFIGYPLDKRVKQLTALSKAVTGLSTA
ncbi:MAG: hypothetical protein QXE96_04035 [Candidatus Caldarchaeum sp.]